MLRVVMRQPLANLGYEHARDRVGPGLIVRRPIQALSTNFFFLYRNVRLIEPALDQVFKDDSDLPTTVKRIAS